MAALNTILRLRLTDGAIHLTSEIIFQERLAAAVSFVTWDTRLIFAAGKETSETRLEAVEYEPLDVIEH